MNSVELCFFVVCFWPQTVFSCTFVWFFLLSSGSFLTAHQTCVSRCPAGTFSNKASSQCEDCVTGCFSCQDDKHCQRCRRGLFLQDEACVSSCQRCIPCSHISGLANIHTIKIHQCYNILSCFCLEGFLKMLCAGRVPQSVRPAGGTPLTVWAVRNTSCCWSTHAGLTVSRDITPPRQNAIAVQLSVQSAIKMACVTVSKLRIEFEGGEKEDVEKRIKERCCFERWHRRLGGEGRWRENAESSFSAHWTANISAMKLKCERWRVKDIEKITWQEGSGIQEREEKRLL